MGALFSKNRDHNNGQSLIRDETFVDRYFKSSRNRKLPSVISVFVLNAFVFLSFVMLNVLTESAFTFLHYKYNRDKTFI